MGLPFISALQAVSPDGKGIGRALVGLVTPTGEPQKGYMWEVHIRGSVYAGDAGIIDPTPFTKTLHYYAQSVSIPESSVEVIEDSYLGEKYHHAGKDASAKTIAITFWDDQNLYAYQFFQNWMNLMHSAASNIGRQAMKRVYCRDATIQLKDTSDLFINAEIAVQYLFPTRLSDVSLDYNATDVMTFTVDFVYDSKVVGEFKKEQAPT